MVVEGQSSGGAVVAGLKTATRDGDLTCKRMAGLKTNLPYEETLLTYEEVRRFI